MNQKFDDRCEDLVKKAANPDSMGGHGQPTGRPDAGREENDSNHPQGGSSKAPDVSKKVPTSYP